MYHVPLIINLWSVKLESNRKKSTNALPKQLPHCLESWYVIQSFLYSPKMFANHAVGYFHFHQGLMQNKHTFSIAIKHIFHTYHLKKDVMADIVDWEMIKENKPRHTWVKLLLGSTWKFSIQISDILNGDFSPRMTVVYLRIAYLNICSPISILFSGYDMAMCHLKEITCVWIIKDAPCR